MKFKCPGHKTETNKRYNCLIIIVIFGSDFRVHDNRARGAFAAFNQYRTVEFNSNSPLAGRFSLYREKYTRIIVRESDDCNKNNNCTTTNTATDNNNNYNNL